eukprot:1002673-Pyramimonas_sp.AAC.1
MKIALGETRHVLGPVERAHQVLQETLELWFEGAGLERNVENLYVALDCAPCKINRMVRRRGC